MDKQRTTIPAAPGFLAAMLHRDDLRARDAEIESWFAPVIAWIVDTLKDDGPEAGKEHPEAFDPIAYTAVHPVTALDALTEDDEVCHIVILSPDGRASCDGFETKRSIGSLLRALRRTYGIGEP